MNRFLLWLTAALNLRVRLIRINGEPYLERYSLVRARRWFPFEIYLHRFLSADGDRELHTHPWRWACGIPLCGGYIEERLAAWCVDPLRRIEHRLVRVGTINRITGLDFHRIEQVWPDTWTLFIHHRDRHPWGFLDLVVSEISKGVLLLKFREYEDAGSMGGTWQEKAPRAREYRKQQTEQQEQV